jgi:hypothetical protein
MLKFILNPDELLICPLGGAQQGDLGACSTPYAVRAKAEPHQAKTRSETGRGSEAWFPKSFADTERPAAWCWFLKAKKERKSEGAVGEGWSRGV